MIATMQKPSHANGYILPEQVNTNLNAGQALPRKIPSDRLLHEIER